ncbi:hypothetical protein ACTFQF_17595 [Aliivibrio fischeri]|uniref:hypothetical protein n=1 Tax=Aliivibrio fischeri TaxID=668 RepID=UPI0007C4FCA3|nr:hypothetical protein [Aliivibrio fischeri]MBP3139217.1 hypothetical protein [Aliivibrio fischeri]MBP3154807.1 hypothetical protein [Aliivibrio fischeri]MCE7574535.1 hypothetical protein [Aliivibrio fischeri]MUJ36034.1 hypothetical protein [Aliivibrio fischeri]MUK92463.1 hypothetical protein [Aliivibrio fischeri]
MNTPIHAINIDFSHSSEAKLLHRVIENQMNPCNDPQEDNYLSAVLVQLEESIELLESLEE